MVSGLSLIHGIAEELFGDGYTVERREFADGDTRTVIQHNVGWSPTCYVQVTVWVGRGMVWIEYYEDDVRRCRERLPFEDFDADRDPLEYVWSDS